MVPRQRTGDDLPRAEPPPLVLNFKLTEGGTAMRRRIVAFTVAALLTGAAGVSAQIYAPQSVERYFRLEGEATRGRKGPAVEGYVYNAGPRNAEHMRLQIERLAVSGKVVARDCEALVLRAHVLRVPRTRVVDVTLDRR